MEKNKEATSEVTMLTERVNNIPKLIINIDRYLKSISDEVDRREDIKPIILETKKNSKGEPTKHFKNMRNFKNFENFCEYVDSRIELEKEQIFKERCLVSTKKRLLKILHMSKPTLDRLEKIGIIEKRFGLFNLLDLRERLISIIRPDLKP